MIGWLTTTIEAVSLLMAAWFLIQAFRDKAMMVPHLIGMAVLWLLTIGQAVVSAVMAAGGDGPEEAVTFIGYLATVVLLPPACAVWGFMERSRWGPAVIALACFILPVLMVRLEQTWSPVLA
ncbi:hypothetical protein [Nocardiopsis potens]|uniref:hypothetical protein n=1 Tax=Nocardiopsis potens TaxID=1246458 RepID=UPI00034AFC0F|nr:hypothetical protein [Nocardiopsis potens]